MITLCGTQRATMDCVDNAVLGGGIEGGGGFVHNEYFGVSGKGTGNVDALTLASAETASAIAYHGINALR